MAEPVLHARGLGYAYPEAGSPALRDITLTVEAGEFVVLAGRSGSGKSTLLHAFCGLVPHFHGGTVEGELEVAGLDVRAHGPAELAAVTGLVSQEPETQVVSTTVRAELGLPLELRGHPPAARSRAVEEVALSLAIDGLLDRTTDTLSGGELQRVALAASLVTRPRVVLLDEPTSQLDPVAGDELIGLLRRLNEEWGVTVVLGEHRLERCLAAADRVLTLEGGRVAFDGAPSRFLDWALEADPVLATPGARLLANVGLSPHTTVRAARAELTKRGYEPPESGAPAMAPHAPRASRSPDGPVLRCRNLWLELGESEELTEALRGVDLELDAGERVALMGRNGAGKTSLLRVAAGLADPDRGRVEAPSGVALLPQRPGDLFAHETVEEELGESAKTVLPRFGLQALAGADPRDISGGERQRLALAIVTAGRTPGATDLPGALLLDEPTRGMDRARKQDLAELIEGWSANGAAVLVATHDVEFASAFADRVILMGRGEIAADAGPSELLAGGWYFSSEVARILEGGAVTVEEGAEFLRAEIGGERPPARAGRDR